MKLRCSYCTSIWKAEAILNPRALSNASDSAYGITGHPRSHWRRIRTTNGLERINKGLKRRTRVVGAFPNDQSFMRLGASILIDINEEWMTTKKYLSMDTD